MSVLVGAQSYDWLQILEAEGRPLEEHLDEVLGWVAECGIECWEQNLPAAADIPELRRLLERHGLRMVSAYTGGEMHTERWPATAGDIAERAEAARELGIRIIVMNPDPRGWGEGAPLKTDADLRRQAEAMQALGERLNAQGQQLAYHTHDAEMRAAAREFHHSLLGTDPERVGLCLDTHWVYRGAGNSEVALYDIVRLYGERIHSLHLRQSQGGVWSETVEEGDIDYAPLASRLKELSFTGPIIIERAIEAGTPQTMSPVEAHRRSADWVRRVFGRRGEV